MVWWLRHWTAKLYEQSSSSSKPTAGKDLENFLLKFLDLTIYQQVPKLFSRHELRGLVDKTTSKQPKVQQFEPTAFQDRQTAETSGNYYYNSGGKLEGRQKKVQEKKKKNFNF